MMIWPPVPSLAPAPEPPLPRSTVDFELADSPQAVETSAIAVNARTGIEAKK
jgi:hypothetical protein